MDRIFLEGPAKSLEDFDTLFCAYAAPEHAQCRNHPYSLPSPAKASTVMSSVTPPLSMVTPEVGGFSLGFKF